jgi:hypothetical protein
LSRMNASCRYFPGRVKRYDVRLNVPFLRLQGKIVDLKSEIKRLEHDKLMEQKDKDTELALLQSSADNLSKKLIEREIALSALRESSLLELHECKSKFKALKADLQMKHNKEQEDSSKRYEISKTKLEHAVHVLKEELNANELVSTYDLLSTVTPSTHHICVSIEQELKVSEEKMRCLVVSEQQANCFLDDMKCQLEAQVIQSRVSTCLLLKLVPFQIFKYI